jgi:single-strand DNA-binding protein
MDINKVFIIGRLVRDAELKYTATGQPVSKFSLAVNEKKKSGDEWVGDVNYFDITLWGKQAESLDQYLTKGKQIAIDGKLKQERWTDRESGQGRSKISVTAFNIQLLGSGKDSTGSQSGYAGDNEGDGYGSGTGYGTGGYSASVAPAQSTPATASRTAAPAEPPPNDDGFVDDIPF